jgi:hypothetical protein
MYSRFLECLCFPITNFEVLFTLTAWGTAENLKIIKSGLPVFGQMFEPGTLWQTHRSKLSFSSFFTGNFALVEILSKGIYISVFITK